jgi:hypothetical protein
VNLILLKVDVTFFWGGGLDLKSFGNYLNSLIKLMVCGADDILFSLDLCLCPFVLLDLFFLFLWVDFVVLGVCILL